MDREQTSGADINLLLAVKADKLNDLLKRRPGQSDYKSTLRAFLEADAVLERAKLAQTRTFAH